MVCSVGMLWALSACQRPAAPCGHNWHEVSALVASHPDSAQRVLHTLPDSLLPSEAARHEWQLLRTWADYRLFAPHIDTAATRRAVNHCLLHATDEPRALAYYLRAVVLCGDATADPVSFATDLLRGMRAAERTDNHFLRAQLFHRYGVLLSGNGRQAEALSYLTRFLHETRATGNYRQEVIALINLSNCYLADPSATPRHAHTACRYAERALALARQHHLQVEYAKALGQLALCYNRLDRPAQALPYAREALQRMQQLQAKGRFHQPCHYMRLADIFRKLGQADSALYYIDREERENGQELGVAASQLRYIVWRDLLHNADSTAKYMEQHRQRQQALNRSQAVGEMLAREAALRHEAAVEAQQERTARQRRLLAAGIAALLALLGAGMVCYGRYRRHMQQHDDALERQQRDMERTAQRITQGEARERRLADALVQQLPLVATLHGKPRYLEPKDWEALRKLTDEAYNHFTQRLTAQFGILTALDVQYCLAIKLNFDIAHLARFTGVTSTTVSRHKLRLKNRLLQAEPHLLDHHIGLDAWVHDF